MVRRGAGARFMAGAWVFPGGVVDRQDHQPHALATLSDVPPDDLGPSLVAAFREVVEETAVWLTEPPVVEPIGGRDVFAVAAAEERRFSLDHTVYFANWITPTMIPVRFDARFFLVGVADVVVPVPDEREVDAAEFVAPSEALRRAAEGEWLVPFPTQRTLLELAPFDSVDAALDYWRHNPVLPVQPRMRVAADGSLEVVMPGDDGFDELDDVEPDPDTLARAARAAARKGKRIAEVEVD